MKLSPTLETAFSNQITLEVTASTVYRQLAIEMDVLGLSGMAAWLRHQADEEVVHANKFIDHVVDRGNHPQIGAVEAPRTTVDNALACFQAALAHEEKVSAAIRQLYRTADQEGDLDSRPMLDWFLTEQVEEEAATGDIVTRLELIGADGPGLLRLDAELGRRPAGTTEDSQG